MQSIEDQDKPSKTAQEKFMDIIELLKSRARGALNKEISEKTGLSASQVSQKLAPAIKRGWVEKKLGRFHLGPFFDA